jgi:hypothetical protein
MARRARGSLWMAGMAVFAIAATLGVVGTAARFTNQYDATGELNAGRVFPGEREAVPFDVTDSSGGSPVNASNPYAFASDGLTGTTSAWATAFAADRYLEFALNSPLPKGLGMTSASLSFRFASATPGATACYWLEIRSESSGSLIETHGASGSALDCVTGMAQATSTTSLGSIATTTVANDLRVRIYGTDSATSGMIVDELTLSGDYGLASFTLYPSELRDYADTTLGVTHWGPAGQ